jgi:hypothetical protein
MRAVAGMPKDPQPAGRLPALRAHPQQDGAARSARLTSIPGASALQPAGASLTLKATERSHEYRICLQPPRRAATARADGPSR